MVTIDKEFLRTFVESLNTLNVSMGNRFPSEFSEKEVGGFELNVEEFIVEDILETKCVKIRFYYIERNKRHPIYYKSFMLKMCTWTQVSEDEFFRHAYFEIMNHLLFSIDCVGKLKGADDRNIDVLSIQTILKEGLKQIDNGK
jgi:hypothetical protein